MVSGFHERTPLMERRHRNLKSLPDWLLPRVLRQRVATPNARVRMKYGITATIMLEELITVLVQDQIDTAGTRPTANHRRLARLGIRAWLTTNFDDLLEQTLEDR